MLLEFKRKSDAENLKNILTNITGDMNEEEIANKFGLTDKDAKKIFSKQKCFSDLTPAERLEVSDCKLFKSGKNFCLDIDYEFPEDSGESEHDLASWFEMVCRKLKLKIIARPPLRKQSDYLNSLMQDILEGSNIRLRAQLVSSVCNNRLGSLKKIHISQLLEIFENEIDGVGVTAFNKKWLVDACASLYHHFSSGDMVDKNKANRYLEIATRIKSTDVVERNLKNPEKSHIYRIAFRKENGENLSTKDYKLVIDAIIDNFGYAVTDFRAHQIGNQADGYDEVRSIAHLEKILKNYPDNESIYLSLSNNPVFYLPLFIYFADVIRSIRNDVLIDFQIKEIVINKNGVNFDFRSCDIGSVDDFVERLTLVRSYKFFVDVIHSRACLMPIACVHK